MIKHYVRKGRYVCNKDVKPTKGKIAKTWADVTCKNCLRQQPPQRLLSLYDSSKFFMTLGELKGKLGV